MRLRLRFPALFLAACGAFFASEGSARAAVLPPALTACVVVDSAPSIRPALRSVAIGDRVTFFVEETFDRSGRSQITATLRAIGSRSIVYVEDAYFNARSADEQQTLRSAASALAEDFDRVIYPGLTTFYGAPWEPGIDGDARITILLTNLVESAGGYVDTTDMFPREQASDSNEREMIYLNVAQAAQPQRINDFTAHEFTHLIDFYQKKKLRNVDEEVWLNELRAEYAGTQLGYDHPYATSNLAARAAAFSANPSDSLTEWKNREPDYAAANLFAQYVAGRYGAQVLAATMQSSSVGIAAIDEALAGIGATDRFADIVQSWAVANFVNDSRAGDRYVYAQADLRGRTFIVLPTASVSIPPSASVEVSRQIEDWSGQWITVTPTENGNTTLVASIEAGTPVSARIVLRAPDGAFEVRAFEPGGSGASTVVANITQFVDATVIPVFAGKTSGFSTGDPYGTYPDEPLRAYTVRFERVSSGAPVIASVSPSHLIAAGGSAVTVRGSGFSGSAVAATLDGVPLALTPVDDGTVVFTAPPHAEGSACLRIVVDGTAAERCDLIAFVAHRNGSLIRAEGRPEVWVVQGQFRRHIVSPRIFDAYRHFSWEAVEVVPEEVAAQFRFSAWVRLPVTDDPATRRVYEINGDATKHWVTCANPDFCDGTWRARGGNPAGIYTVNQAEMDFYQTGPHVFLR